MKGAVFQHFQLKKFETAQGLSYTVKENAQFMFVRQWWGSLKIEVLMCMNGKTVKFCWKSISPWIVSFRKVGVGKTRGHNLLFRVSNLHFVLLEKNRFLWLQVLEDVSFGPGKKDVKVTVYLLFLFPNVLKCPGIFFETSLRPNCVQFVLLRSWLKTNVPLVTLRMGAIVWRLQQNFSENSFQQVRQEQTENLRKKWTGSDISVVK